MIFTKSKVALALAVLASASAFAQTKAPEPDYTLSYNVGAVSDYRFRGIMQTHGGGAVQGGVDYAHKNGVYLGAWASNIRWIGETCKSAGVSCSNAFELDLYGGYKGEITKDIGYDIGLISYQYVGNHLSNAAPTYSNATTTEVYAGLSRGPLSAKYSHSVSNMLGLTNSKGSHYFEVNGNFEMSDGYTIVAHAGRQYWAGVAPGIAPFTSNAAYNYTDYKLGFTKDVGNGVTVGLAAVGTNADPAGWTYNGKNWGKKTAVASVLYAF